MISPNLIIYGAAEHNLKHINVEIPRNSFTVVTGLSGSGKSSLAFDTIYAEGQRRYVESLSAYARQFLDQLQKPKVDRIEGLSPAISIEQKSVSKNPRSTVGTVTEIYDYLRVLYANVGRPHCPHCNRLLERQTVQDIVDTLLALPEGTKVVVMAPVVRGRKGTYEKLFEQALKEGFVRARVDGEIVELSDPIKLKKTFKHTIEIVIDRLTVKPDIATRLTDSVEVALKKAEGLVSVLIFHGSEKSQEKTFSEAMACPEHGPQLLEQTPRIFSFNSPYGACPACNGLGTSQEVDIDLLIPDPSLSVLEGAVNFWGGLADGGDAEDAKGWTAQFIRSVADHFEIDLTVPFKRLPKKHREILLYGSGDVKIPVRYKMGTGAEYANKQTWEGAIPRIYRMLKETNSEMMRDYYMSWFNDAPCPACKGARLKPEALAVTVGGMNLSQFTALTVSRARAFVEGLSLTPREQTIATQPLKEIRERLSFLENVGLNYL
ncbi:MAG: excinuclease ABC subunit UvrA, partial [Candidatus Sumerlaeota bacterium]|nr:excinuclease ABC subunit UvrA [Candidatus Sumerlaeota bacterium]